VIYSLIENIHSFTHCIYTMKITIRQANEADISLLADIGRQTFYDAFKDNNSSQENFEKYLVEAFDLQKTTNDFHTNTNLFLLAENEKKEAVAYAKLRWDGRRDNLIPHKNYIEVERIYVQKNYWSMGIGKLMMEDIFDLARRREYECVCLSVYEENAAAIRFYRRLGFQDVGVVIFELGDVVERDILMMRNVT